MDGRLMSNSPADSGGVPDRRPVSLSTPGTCFGDGRAGFLLATRSRCGVTRFCVGYGVGTRAHRAGPGTPQVQRRGEPTETSRRPHATRSQRKTMLAAASRWRRANSPSGCVTGDPSPAHVRPRRLPNSSAADRESVLIHTQPCTAATVPRSYGLPPHSIRIWDDDDHQEVLGIGKTRLGDDEAAQC